MKLDDAVMHPSRIPRIYIDCDALKHNFQRVKALAPESQVMAVIKADAYGHGAQLVANSLDQADAFALATTGEAIQLRQAGINQALVVLQGFADEAELRAMVEFDIQPVVHQLWQVALLEKLSDYQIDLWLKVDTGMHRMGVKPSEALFACQRLNDCDGVRQIRLMSHFANADDPDNILNNKQIDSFLNVVNRLNSEASMANSAALIALPESRLQWVRPGIMLYGSSPLLHRSATELGLQAVMNFESRLLAVVDVDKGDAVGYGSSWTCPENMQVGIVAAGYADGYPRHAVSGTPVWINGVICPMVGRVSMDSISIDLRGVDASAGDRVVLWGRELPVDEVASHASTIAYELLCHAGQAVPSASRTD